MCQVGWGFTSDIELQAIRDRFDSYGVLSPAATVAEHEPSYVSGPCTFKQLQMKAGTSSRRL